MRKIKLSALFLVVVPLFIIGITVNFLRVIFEILEEFCEEWLDILVELRAKIK